jgi:hypothetical protein
MCIQRKTFWTDRNAHRSTRIDYAFLESHNIHRKLLAMRLPKLAAFVCRSDESADSLQSHGTVRARLVCVVAAWMLLDNCFSEQTLA